MSDDAIAETEEATESQTRYESAFKAWTEGKCSWDDVLEAWNQMAFDIGEWGGVPFPVPDIKLCMEKNFPFRAFDGANTQNLDQKATENRKRTERELSRLSMTDEERKEDERAERLERLKRLRERLAEKEKARLEVVKAEIAERIRSKGCFEACVLDLPESPGFDWGKDWDSMDEDGKTAAIEMFAKFLVNKEPVWRRRNKWYSARLDHEIEIIEDMTSGKIAFKKAPASFWADRWIFFIDSVKASGAWSLRAELKAMEKLKSFIDEEQYRQYVLTGSFMERSKRTGLCYLFRKGKPTVCVRYSQRDDEFVQTRFLGALCLHPIGYYQGTWAGVLVPTDDIIAHLLMMRSDEYLYWKKANVHPMHEIQAGI